MSFDEIISEVTGSLEAGQAIVQCLAIDREIHELRASIKKLQDKRADLMGNTHIKKNSVVISNGEAIGVTGSSGYEQNREIYVIGPLVAVEEAKE